MLDADAVINNSSQKVGGSGPRKTHRIYAPADNTLGPSVGLPRPTIYEPHRSLTPHDSDVQDKLCAVCSTSETPIFMRPPPDQRESILMWSVNIGIHSATAHSSDISSSHGSTPSSGTPLSKKPPKWRHIKYR